jgi:hypothetical protein
MNCCIAMSMGSGPGRFFPHEKETSGFFSVQKVEQARAIRFFFKNPDLPENLRRY